MKKIAEQERKSNGLSVKVVERCGIKLKAQLPGLQEVTECQETDCFLHLTGGKGSHGSESVVYKGDCETCLVQGPCSQPRRDGTIVMRTDRIVGTKAGYYGETYRSIYVRGKQHLSALEKADQHKDNAFVNHRNNFHKGEEQEVRFKRSLVKKFKRPRSVRYGRESRYTRRTWTS